MENKDRKIGVELEFPVIKNSNFYSIRRPDIQKVWKEFLKKRKDWKPYVEPIRKKTTGVTRYNRKYDELINTDNSVGQLEFAMGPETKIASFEKKWKEAFKDMLKVCNDLDYSILGTGYHPMTHLDRNIRSEKDWYIIFHKYYFRHAWMAAGFAANQPSVDVPKEEAFRAVSTLTKLSGLMVALFASSPIMKGEKSKWKESRNMLWYELYKRERDWIPYVFYSLPKLWDNAQDYIEWNWGIRSAIFAEHKKGGKYIPGFPPFKDYIQSDKEWKAKTVDGKPTTKRPKVSDIQNHSEYGWPFAKLKLKYDEKMPLEEAVSAYKNKKYQDIFDKYVNKTFIEYRVIGTQLPEEEMVPAAVVMGIVCNLNAAEKLMKNKDWKECQKILREASIKGMNAKIDGEPIHLWVKKMVSIAEKGLKTRGYGEEKYLAPAINRLKKGRCPADDILESYKKGKIKEVVNKIKYTNG